MSLDGLCNGFASLAKPRSKFVNWPASGDAFPQINMFDGRENDQQP